MCFSGHLLVCSLFRPLAVAAEIVAIKSVYPSSYYYSFGNRTAITTAANFNSKFNFNFNLAGATIGLHFPRYCYSGPLLHYYPRDCYCALNLFSAGYFINIPPKLIITIIVVTAALIKLDSEYFLTN